MGVSRSNGRPRAASFSLLVSSLFQLSTVVAKTTEASNWTPSLVKETLESWGQDYPQLLRTTSAQEAYGIPRAGGADDCPDEDDDGCSQVFFTIQDFVTHPDGSESSSYLPEVFWSGTLHGDEVLGPSVVMEAASILLESAACEAKPGPQPDLQELGDAKACRVSLEKRGVDAFRRRWLARLVSTRRIIVVPSANSLGYFAKTHEEGQVDPARDFAYDKEIEPTLCMQTTAARAINEIFRDHMFQMAISFHSGIGAVGFPWRTGAESSPDKLIQLQVAQAYSRTVSGTFIYEESRDPNTLFESSTSLYTSAKGEGPDEFRRHKGSFEDWAYGASWDTFVSTCSPVAFGGYPTEKTEYNNSTNRALSMFAFIDDGDHNETRNDASIKDNVRLALASVDLVQPYVNILGVNSFALSDDIVPLTDGAEKSCFQSKSVITSSRATSLTVEWTVGGALNIDYTQLYYAKNLDIDAETTMHCLLQPDELDMRKFDKASSLRKPKGSGFYSPGGPNPHPSDSSAILGPVFNAEVDLEGFSPGDRIIVIAIAQVDQEWNPQPTPRNASSTNPESHLANARTNPAWEHENAGKRIKGRLNWFSVPLTIILQDFDVNLGTLEVYDRFDQDKAVHEQQNKDDGLALTSDVNNFVAVKVIWQAVVALVSIFAILVVMMHQVKRRSMIDQIQSVLDAERENEQVHIHSFSDDPVVEEDIIDFDSEGIYRRSPNPLRSSTRRNKCIDFDGAVSNRSDHNPESSAPQTKFETIRII
eukprot:scaffold3084_cov144-Cylindrotheca_fusiformis.AAC.37